MCSHVTQLFFKITIPTCSFTFSAQMPFLIRIGERVKASNEWKIIYEEVTFQSAGPKQEKRLHCTIVKTAKGICNAHIEVEIEEYLYFLASLIFRCVLAWIVVAVNFFPFVQCL